MVSIHSTAVCSSIAFFYVCTAQNHLAVLSVKTHLLVHVFSILRHSGVGSVMAIPTFSSSSAASSSFIKSCLWRWFWRTAAAPLFCCCCRCCCCCCCCNNRVDRGAARPFPMCSATDDDGVDNRATARSSCRRWAGWRRGRRRCCCPSRTSSTTTTGG